MNVALVKCPWWVRYCPPYILAYFATLLRKNNYPVSVYDLNNILYHKMPQQYRKFWDDRDYYSVWETPSYIEKIMDLADMEDETDRILSSSPEIICFTTHTPNTLFSEKLAEKIKEKESKVIIIFMGHKCARTQMAYDFIEKPFIDYVCTGEADIALPRLIKKLENRSGKKLPGARGFLYKSDGEIKDGGTPTQVKDIGRLPFPDYRDFREEIEKGLYSQPERLDILDSRGCPNACHFCYERLYWGKYRSMSGDNIYRQIRAHREEFPGIKYFYFNGLLLNGSLDTLNSFCDRVIEDKMPITWAGQAAVRGGMKYELLKKMREAGCVWLGFGVESGSDKILGEMNKRHSSKEALDLLKKTRRAGISVQINIMFGYPTETEDDFNETLKFIEKASPYIDNVLASQSFCTLEKETYLRKNPEEFGITGNYHHLYWKSQGGKNNYAERFRRYEEFCRKAIELGIPETSGVLLKKPDKWLLLGDYYRYEKNYDMAAEFYEKSLAEETVTKTLYLKLAEIHKIKNNKNKYEQYKLKAAEMGDSPFTERNNS